MISRCSLFLTLSALAVVLSSCGTLPTQYMPNGYRYNDDTPLSSPAPSRPWRKEAERTSLENLGDNTAAWQGAVYELISALPQNLPTSAGPVTLVTQKPFEPVDTSFEHYLRQGLVSYGYTVNPVSTDPGTLLVYEAQPLNNPENIKRAEAKFGKEFVKKDNMEGMYYLTLEIKDTDGKTKAGQATIGVFPHEGK